MKTQFTRSGAVALLLLAGAVAPAYSQESQDAKAGEVLAKTRKALGDKKLEGLKTLSAHGQMDRNLGSVQASSDVELLIELPGKYVKSEASRGMANMTMSTGFNGEKAILPGGGNIQSGPGGAMVFRMGPGGSMHGGEGTKPTPEQLVQLNATSLKGSRAEVSRMMLGWFGAAHPAVQANYTYAGEAESRDGKAHVIDVKAADGFEARLFRSEQLPAADGDLQGTAAADDDERWTEDTHHLEQRRTDKRAVGRGAQEARGRHREDAVTADRGAADVGLLALP